MLKENVEKVLLEIANGNNLGETITLVGATKTIPVDVINQSIEYGVKVVAENKVNEFREKTDGIIGASQHFIGHLQTNKVKYLVGKVELIHSVDSLHLAKAVSEQAVKKDVVQNILVQINIGREEQKGGISPDQVFEQIKEFAILPNLNIVGLMAMLPISEDKDYLKNLCLQMREFYDKLNIQGYNLKYLSVGMSADYKIAIQNGSNMIRLGSIVYGKRNYGGI